MNIPPKSLVESSENQLEMAQSLLLPNEKTEFVCSTNNGFLVVSDRRLLVIKNQKKDSFEIEDVIPLDCFQGISLYKKNKMIVSGTKIDSHGYMIRGDHHHIQIEMPKGKQGEEIGNMAIEEIPEIVESIRSSYKNSSYTPIQRDYKYLDDLPEYLTNNGILDLNTILQDQPIHDTLYHHASKYLGNNSFILEESLRSGEDLKNGILFAAGKSGYIWIQGQKEGRHMQDILVDMIEWKNINCLIHQWQNNPMSMNIVYSLQEGRDSIEVSYVWWPRKIESYDDHHWLFESLNGPWIFADLFFKYSEQPLLASRMYGMKSHQTKILKSRFFH